MKTKQITRIISYMFSCLFFFLSVAITIFMSLAIFGTYEDQSIFLQLMLAIVATYKFSSFLLPIILLYASIILFMPGWTRHSKATLLASPFCFFTSVAGEYSLYTFVPAIQNATIASFVQLAIVLITLLLICVEFMMSHLIAVRIFQNYKPEVVYEYDVDIIADEYSSEKLNKSLYHEEEEKDEKPKETFFSMFNFEKESTPLEKRAEENNLKENKLEAEHSKDVPIINEDDLESDVSDEVSKMQSVDEPSTMEEASKIQSSNIPSIIEEDSEEKENEKVQNIEEVESQNIENIEEIEKTIEQTLKKIDDVIKENETEERSLSEDEAIIEKFEDDGLKENEAFTQSLNEAFTQSLNVANEENDFNQNVFKDEEVKNAEKEAIIKDATISEIIKEETPKDAIIKEEIVNKEIITEAKKEDESFQPIKDVSEFSVKIDVSNNGAEMKEAETKEKEHIGEDSNIEDAYIKEELEKIKQVEATSFKPLVANVRETPQGYHIPFDLLTEYPGNDYWIIDSSTRQAAFRLKSTLNEFKINVEITGIRKGPVVTMFEVLPPPGIKLAKITALQDNIALRLAAESVRIVAPIPGKRAVGIEIPNDKRSIVGFRELIQVQNPDAKKMAIPIVLGKDITGEPQTIDLAQTPHLLIAGATGAGKSVCVNSIILSILYNNKPNEVKLLLVDPKIVELKLYNDIGHLLTPVITESKKAFQALQYCICEMERRYAFLDKMKVRDIKSYNKKIRQENLVMERLPYIVIIIDEFADLMATTGKELEGTVSRLCAMSRAVGIHLVLATQRPSADVITGLIKANIPSRIAFMVASKVDSRIILDDGGADKLLGKGDMLYVSPSRPWPTRIQGAFVSEEEVEKVVEKVKSFGEPDYIDDEIFMDEAEEAPVSFFGEESDPLYDEAVDIVLHEGKASASYIQRRLKIGYNRAARILEEMEEKGVVGPANGSKPRDILQSY